MPAAPPHNHPSPAAPLPAVATITTLTTLSTILPIELLVAIFENLDGHSLARCSVVCSTWATVIRGYDDVLWRNAARRDLDHDGGRMFWSLRVPDPRVVNTAPTHNTPVLNPSDSETDEPTTAIPPSAPRKRTWRDMYRITRNWYTANARGHFPRVAVSSSSIPAHLLPICVVGTPQESSFDTTLTLTHHGLIVRSNPSYRLPDGSDARVILMQDPRTGEVVSHIEDNEASGITCHHTGTRSRWLVTGSLDGSVRVWDLEGGKKVKTWVGHRGRVLSVGMNNSVVVSGGSDSTIRVWDLVNTTPSPQTPHTTWRGTIDISAYLSAADDAWFTGASELAVSDTLVACASDSTGPILVFSLLTGALVYEIGLPAQGEVGMPFALGAGAGPRKLYMTPFFLLTTGRVVEPPPAIPVAHEETWAGDPTPGWTILSTRVGQPCVNVWDLRTGRMLHRLVPRIEESVELTMRSVMLVDVRTSEDQARLVMSLCDPWSGVERLYMWDFEGERKLGKEGTKRNPGEEKEEKEESDEEKEGSDEKKGGEEEHEEKGGEEEHEERFVVQEVVEEGARKYREVGRCFGKAWVCWM